MPLHCPPHLYNHDKDVTTDTLRHVRTPVNGVLVHARIGGTPAADRPAVILLHGLSISSRYLAPLAIELAEWTYVAAPDIPGFGLSGKPGRILDIPGMADAMVGWMGAMEIPHAILAGNSAGSQVAVNLAVRYPGRAAGLVLTGLALGGQRRGVWSQLGRAVVDVPREPLALWPMQARDFIAAGPRRVVRTLQLAMNDRMEELIPEITVPTLVVEGARDPMDDPEWNRTLVAALPRGRLATVPRGTHALPMSEPRELARLIQEFALDLEDLPAHAAAADAGLKPGAKPTKSLRD